MNEGGQGKCEAVAGIGRAADIARGREGRQAARTSLSKSYSNVRVTFSPATGFSGDTDTTKFCTSNMRNSVR